MIRQINIWAKINTCHLVVVFFNLVSFMAPNHHLAFSHFAVWADLWTMWMCLQSTQKQTLSSNDQHEQTKEDSRRESVYLPTIYDAFRVASNHKALTAYWNRYNRHGVAPRVSPPLAAPSRGNSIVICLLLIYYIDT